MRNEPPRVVWYGRLRAWPVAEVCLQGHSETGTARAIDSGNSCAVLPLQQQEWRPAETDWSGANGWEMEAEKEEEEVVVVAAAAAVVAVLEVAALLAGEQTRKRRPHLTRDVCFWCLTHHSNGTVVGVTG